MSYGGQPVRFNLDGTPKMDYEDFGDEMTPNSQLIPNDIQITGLDVNL